MILDREEHEAVWVLLKERLVGFTALDRWGNIGKLNRLLLDILLNLHVGGDRQRRVFLAGSFEIKLLRRVLAHLEVLQ